MARIMSPARLHTATCVAGRSRPSQPRPVAVTKRSPGIRRRAQCPPIARRSRCPSRRWRPCRHPGVGLQGKGLLSKCSHRGAAGRGHSERRACRTDACISTSKRDARHGKRKNIATSRPPNEGTHHNTMRRRIPTTRTFLRDASSPKTRARQRQIKSKRRAHPRPQQTKDRHRGADRARAGSQPSQAPRGMDRRPLNHLSCKGHLAPPSKGAPRAELVAHI